MSPHRAPGGVRARRLFGPRPRPQARPGPPSPRPLAPPPAPAPPRRRDCPLPAPGPRSQRRRSPALPSAAPSAVPPPRRSVVASVRRPPPFAASESALCRSASAPESGQQLREVGQVSAAAGGRGLGQEHRPRWRPGARLPQAGLEGRP